MAIKSMLKEKSTNPSAAYMTSGFRAFQHEGLMWGKSLLGLDPTFTCSVPMVLLSKNRRQEGSVSIITGGWQRESTCVLIWLREDSTWTLGIQNYPLLPRPTEKSMYLRTQAPRWKATSPSFYQINVESTFFSRTWWPKYHTHNPDNI